MERLKRSSEGFTLLELVVALALGSVVLLTSSNFLINFARFSSNLIKSEASLMGTALGSFEEIVDTITQANKVVVLAEPAMDVPAIARPGGCLTDGTCIQIRMDPLSLSTPTNFSDDTVYNFWMSGTPPNAVLNRSVVNGGGTLIPATVIAKDITRALFVRPDATNMNRVNVILEAQVSSGATTGFLKEALNTTAILRGKGAK